MPLDPPIKRISPLLQRTEGSREDGRDREREKERERGGGGRERERE
jgi:hypothetical protein